MSWVRIDDGFHDHPKIIAAGNEAIGFFVRSLSYCNQHLTDGFVPDTWIRGNGRNIRRTCEALVSHGMFRRVLKGYKIHDYLKYQRSRKQILAERDSARVRMAEVRANRKKSSGELQKNFGRSSGDVRLPHPIPLSTKALSTTPVLTHKLSTGKGLEPIGSIMGRLGGVR